MKKYLITGCAGFIGSNFVHYMLNKYEDILLVNLDKLTYAGNLENLKDVLDDKRHVFVQGDICDKELVSELFNKYDFDYVINFADESHVDRSILNPDVFVKTNVIGTLNLLNAAKTNWMVFPHSLDNHRFHHVSTDEVYGSLDLNPENKFKETTPYQPHSPYSASKASADMLVRAYRETYGLPTLNTRCSNNYGPYQYPEKLIPFFISQLLKGEKVPVYGDGLNVRDWLYVYDHCEAIDIVLHNGKLGEIYNIGGHNEKTNIEITHLILDAMGKDESSIKYVEDRLGHDRRYAISNDKITTELGWQPSITFEEGIKLTIDWYLNNQDWMKSIENKKASLV